MKRRPVIRENLHLDLATGCRSRVGVDHPSLWDPSERFDEEIC